MEFQKDFIWGAATASFQIEGGAYEDGKSPSIWDAFCKEPNRVFDGHNGDTACDHYHRYKEDIQLMKEIGLESYRFSVSWPRILPNGIGEVNEKGVEFYNNLIDALIEADITPVMTLYHWDYPHILYQQGGWLNPNSSLWFEEYAKVIGSKFGDRVKNFITINEPQIFMGHGYYSLEHAPGLKVSRTNLLHMNHNVMLSHGRAVRALRKLVPDCEIGVAFAGKTFLPATDDPKDISAARQANFWVDTEDVTHSNAWWTDTMIFGKYPEEAEEILKDEMPKYTQEEMEIISSPIDYYGINIYGSGLVEYDETNGFREIHHKVGTRKTGIGWAITPGSLYWFPKFVYERYNLPILITENGQSATDGVSNDGKVHDPQRIDYLNDYLWNLRKVVSEGVEVKGYFQWSFLDNFEWAKGYDDRFGIVFIDFETQERILKDSAYWYKDVIKANGSNLVDIL